jgi:DNA polymerase-3 subunit delta
MAGAPAVYIFHGDDEVAIREAIANLQKKLGDPTTADMNTTRLEAGYTLEAIRAAASAAPFLTERRLVVVTNASKAFPSPDAKARFTEFLGEVPPSTALVLLETAALEDKHWLMKWSDSVAGRAFVRQFDLPKGAALATWLRQRATELGGEIQPTAAALLAERLNGDKLSAGHELEKLLAFANYARPITNADVQQLTIANAQEGDFFGLIDALSAGNGAKAIQALEGLLAERDLILLYFSLVGHFRALIQSRDLLDAGKNDADIAKELGMHPYRAQKLAAQAKRFSMASLKQIYDYLLEKDELIKTGELEPALAMETFVAELSAQLA